MCSTNQNFKCCSMENALDVNTNNNQSYSHKVDKQLPPKFLKPIVQNKIVEVPKEVYMEKIIEVPQIKVVERIVEQIKPVIKYKNIYKPKTVYVEKIKNVDKIVYQEKIVHVPQIKTVEKIVEVPVHIERERIIKVPKYMIIERVIPILKSTKIERVIELSSANSPNIDVNNKVEDDHRIDLNDLKENQTTNIVDYNEVQFFHGLKPLYSNQKSTANTVTLKDQITTLGSQENVCTTLGCKLFPLYQNFIKIASPVMRIYQERQRNLNIQDYKPRKSSLPRIRISKTPNLNQRNFYCNCT